MPADLPGARRVWAHSPQEQALPQNAGAAQKELARLVTEQDVDPALVSSAPEQAWGPSTTINDAIVGWRTNGWEGLSPSTRQRYESIWRCHIEGSIGRRKIASLSADDAYDVELLLGLLLGPEGLRARSPDSTTL